MLLRSLGGCVLAVLFMASPSAAQSYSVPTPYPTITANGHEWFEQRLPILLSGDLYYPAGAQYHFDPDIMIPTGAFDGVPLYADASVEAYSQVLVPIGGGLVQPYERRRAGPLAGTTGSHAPAFPVEVVPGEEPAWRPLSSGDRRRWQQPAPEEEAPPRWQRLDEETRSRLLEQPGHIETVRAPEDNRGIWIRFEGQRWTVAGGAVPFDAARFSKIGEYYGFPVYSTSGSEEIFIPAWPGMLTSYRKDTK